MKVVCSNCGTMGEEDAMRCTNCGTTLEYNDMPDPNNPKETDDKNSNKSVIAVAIIAIVAMAITGVVIACVSFVNSNNYKSVIEDKLNAIEQLDPEKLANTYPKFIYLSEEEGNESKVYGNVVRRSYSKFQEYIEYDCIESIENGLFEKLEEEVGDSLKFSYEIKSITDFSEKKHKRFCEAIEEIYKYNTDEIKTIKKADIIVKVKGSDDTYEFDWEDVYLIKDNGQWYLLNDDLENGSLGKKGDYHLDYYSFFRAGAR